MKKSGNDNKRSMTNITARYTRVLAGTALFAFALLLLPVSSSQTYADTVSTRTIGYDPARNKAASDLVQSAAEQQEETVRTPKYTPVSTERTDSSSRFGGGSLTMLANKDNDAQNMSFIFDTGDGLIVVDGGWTENGESLLNELKARGGHVRAWLITHPHNDHALALSWILSNHPNDIAIDGIYYSFFDKAWYAEHDAESAEVYDKLTAAFSNISADKLHGDIKGGDIIEAGRARIQVLNNAYKLKSNSGNNSSVCYMISMNGTNVVFLGDLGLAAGNLMREDVDLRSLQCDIVQVAHHGQEGVDYAFYQQLAPKVMLWPTPEWLWNGSRISESSINMTRSWQSGLLIKEYYVAKDGDVTIR